MQLSSTSTNTICKNQISHSVLLVYFINRLITSEIAAFLNYMADMHSGNLHLPVFI